MVRCRAVVVAEALLVTAALGCRALERGPSEQEVVAAVKASPPSPPTAGPTYLADVESVQVDGRGRYNADGAYWPVRVRVRGGAKIKVTNVFQLGVLDDRAKETAVPVDFVEEARLARDDFGRWRVSYDYDSRGPRWRLSETHTARERQR